MTHSTLTLADAQAQAAAFLAARREKHADFRMDATDGDSGGDSGGKPDPNAQPGNDGGTDGTDGAKPDDKPKSVEEQLAELTSKFDDLKRNSRKWETRARENAEKAKKWDEAQEKNATPDQRLSAAEERAAKAERRLLRYEVAARTGLPSDLVEYLTADDEDAMEEQAKKLIARLAPAKSAPKPDPTQGGTGGKPKASAADVGRAEAQRRIAARKKS